MGKACGERDSRGEARLWGCGLRRDTTPMGNLASPQMVRCSTTSMRCPWGSVASCRQADHHHPRNSSPTSSLRKGCRPGSMTDRLTCTVSYSIMPTAQPPIAHLVSQKGMPPEQHDVQYDANSPDVSSLRVIHAPVEVLKHLGGSVQDTASLHGEGGEGGSKASTGEVVRGQQPKCQRLWGHRHPR